MLEGVRASLDRFRVRMDQFFSERTLHESGEIEAALERLDVYEHDGALWLRTTAYGTDKDSVLRRSNGEWTYFASRHRLPPAQDRARLRPRDRRLGRGPPRPHRAHEGGLAGAGRRPGGVRGRADAAREPHRGRRAGEDVEARRHDRDARRPARRHRRGRRALVPGLAQPRHDARHRPRARAQRVPGQPRLLRPVRARADRVDPAQGGGGAGGAGAGGRPPRQLRAASTPRRGRS